MSPGDVVKVTVGTARVWSDPEDAVDIVGNNNDRPIARLPQGKIALVIAIIEVPSTSGCLLVLFDDVLGYVYSSRVTNAF